jgi:aspartate carbamoyltransferase catalytic subunit
VLHSRVARSLVQAFALVGIRCTLVGPPALLPRDFAAEMTSDIDAIRDADVVYVLRMQNERMEAGANYVPSIREYSARWGITPERLRTGQKVMHPGPMNRGVEIDPRVADSVESLVETQVRSGLVVRMAVLYDVLTGGPVGVRNLAAAEVA